MFKEVTPDFLARLDLNFARVARENGPFAVSTTGFIFTEDDQVDSLYVDATTGNMIVYLPASPTGNRRRTVVKVDPSVNTVTVDGNGNTINGATTYILTNQYDFITVEPGGFSV